MKCPLCRIELADTATYCGCGWKQAVASVKGGSYPPGFVETMAERMSRRQTEADATCARLGLDTLAKKLAWLRENRLIVRRVPAAQREPGEEA